MATETVEFSGGLSYAGEQTVWTRARWADPWTEQPTLFCTSVTWSAQPSVPTATLYRAYGPTLENGSQDSGVREKAEIEGHFVKIKIACADGDRFWYGYVEMVTEESSGTIIAPVLLDGETEPTIQPVACGKQTFACLGIINVLAHSLVTESAFRQALAGFGDINKAFRGKSGFTFNEADGYPVPSKGFDAQLDTSTTTSSVITPNGTYGVNFSESRCSTWTAFEIIKHLIDFHYPAAENRSIRIPFKLDSGFNIFSTWDRPMVETDHRSLLEILDEICSPTRMMSYFATVEEREVDEEGLPVDPNAKDTVVLKSFSTLTQDISLPVGPSRVKNPNLVKIECLNDQATKWVTTLDLSQRANQVICRGAKQVTVFTISCNDGPFRRLWDTSQMTPEPTPGSDPYVNQAERAQWLEHPKNRLYLRGYQLLFNFNWTDINGNHIFTNPDGSKYFPNPYSIEILDRLPFREGYDYSTATKGFDSGSAADFMPPLVYGPRLAYSGQNLQVDRTKYINFANRRKQGLVVGLDQLPYDIDLSPCQLKGRIAILLDVRGASQENLADVPTSTNALTNLPETPHLARYSRLDLRFTIAVTDDRRIEARFPADADLPANQLDAIRRRVLDFGNTFNLVEILKSTTCSIANDGTEQKSSSTEVLKIRDDKEDLQSIAKVAYSYYSQPRKVLRLSSARASAVLDVGKMVETLNESTEQSESINTVITEITITNSVGQPGNVRACEFSMATSAGEMDFLQIVPRR